MSEYKKCPFCAEEILIDAKKCKHCQSMLNNDPPEDFQTAARAPANKLKSRKTPAWKLPVIIVTLLLALVVIVMLIFSAGVRSILRSSEIYSQALSVLSANTEAVQYLGEPIEAGKKVTGSVSTSESIGEADLTIPVKGPINEGTLYVLARKIDNQWTFDSLELGKKDGGRINLLIAAEPELPQGMVLFAEPGYGFVMAFPESWNFDYYSDNGIIFYGAEGTDEYDLEISVELYYTQAAGGAYDNIDSIFNDLKDIVVSYSGSIAHEDGGTDIISGAERSYRLFASSYERDNKQWTNSTIVIQRDERLFYVLYYNAPQELYAENIDYIFDNIISSFAFTDDLDF